MTSCHQPEVNNLRGLQLALDGHFNAKTCKECKTKTVWTPMWDLANMLACTDKVTCAQCNVYCLLERAISLYRMVFILLPAMVVWG